MEGEQRGVNLLRAVRQAFGDRPEPDHEVTVDRDGRGLDSDSRQGPPVKGDTR